MMLGHSNTLYNPMVDNFWYVSTMERKNCAGLSCERLAGRNLQCSTTKIGSCVQTFLETCLICCELVCILLLMSGAKVYVGLN